jgi:hypothetical protein
VTSPSVANGKAARGRAQAGHRGLQRRHHAGPERGRIAVLRVERDPGHAMVVPGRLGHPLGEQRGLAEPGRGRHQRQPRPESLPQPRPQPGAGHHTRAQSRHEELGRNHRACHGTPIPTCTRCPRGAPAGGDAGPTARPRGCGGPSPEIGATGKSLDEARRCDHPEGSRAAAIPVATLPRRRSCHRDLALRLGRPQFREVRPTRVPPA